MIKFAKPYLLADYAEWLVLSESRSEVSRGDLMMEGQLYQDLDIEGDVADHTATGTQQAKSTRLDTQLDDCFDHLQYRERAFGNGYLFLIKNDVLTARPDNAARGDEALVYRFLLACGRTGTKRLVPMAFSELCKLALTRLIGPRGTVYNIDAGSDDRQHLGTDTRDMARLIASTLGCVVVKEHVDQLSGQGDGGADLVASISFGDGATGHVSILGQCAASEDETYWKNKLAQAKRLLALYTWSHDPIMAAFIPVLYRSGNGTWISQSNVYGSVLFDRLRILNALQLSSMPLPPTLRDVLERAVDEAEVISKQPQGERAKRAPKKGRAARKRA